MEAPHRSRLAPRLVLVFAVLACVFGWGDSVAVTPAVPSAGGVHAEAHSGPPGSVHHPAQPAEDGHGGHGSSHDHAVRCMASSAAPTFAAVTGPEAAALVMSAVPPLIRVHEAVLPTAAQRPPSIALLCVQRI